MTKQVARSGERHWYAVHTYAGYENSVIRNLRQRIESLNMQEKIFEVLVPMEKKVKIKGGKRVTVTENICPGYVLVNMIVDDASWYVVRNTPRVTGLVGSGVAPVPLSDEEVQIIFERMNKGEVLHEVDLMKGDSVQIVDGPFSDLSGKIADVDPKRNTVQVMVSMFGRDTQVELDIVQVRRI